MKRLIDGYGRGFKSPALFLASMMISLPAWSAQPGESYLGLGLGESDFSQMTGLVFAWPGVSGVQAEETSRSWKVQTGHQFSPWLAVETAWVDFGVARVSAALQEGGTAALKLDTAGFEFSALATLSVTGELQVFARAGALVWKSRQQLELADGLASDDFGTPDKKGYAPVLGMGAQWDLGSRTSLRLDWEKYLDLADGDPEVWLFSVLRRY